MKYTCCETLMWHALTPAMFQWLKTQNASWDIPALRRRTRTAYRRMVSRTPDIGSLRKNSLRLCLTGGMVWLSAYQAAQGAMSEACFAGMVRASMEAPLVKRAFQGKALFTPEAQKRRAENARLGNALPDSPFNWRTEVVFGRDADEYTVIYRQCGLCALGRQEGLLHLVPHMCVIDTLTVEWMDGVLYRTKTLATGGDCCDFYMCKKGSRWDRERSAAVSSPTAVPED